MPSAIGGGGADVSSPWRIMVPKTCPQPQKRSAQRRCRRMRQGQMRVRLRPIVGGSYTEVRLCGMVPTTVPPRAVQRALSLLRLWSGWPVALALCVEADAAGWCEVWADALADVPADHLEVRFVLPRDRVK
jgi:hypothetical protein